MLVFAWGIALLPCLIDIPSAHGAAVHFLKLGIPGHLPPAATGVPSQIQSASATSGSSTDVWTSPSFVSPSINSTASHVFIPSAAVHITSSAPKESQSQSSAPISNAFVASLDSATRDVTTILLRRLPMIVEEVTTPDVGTASDISQWVTTLGGDGKWPAADIDYTSGCAGQRANWPATDHWKRIAFMAAAWHGGVNGGDQFVNSQSVLKAILRAMDFWFARDFTNPSCLSGQCACSSTGFWNTNWFSNVIGIPKLVGSGCLLMGADSMRSSQLSNCTSILRRAAATLKNGVDGIGQLTGANTLDVAKIATDLGLLTDDPTVITQAYQHAHSEVVVRDKATTDGIDSDGGFGQHGGILYNGNYGKDYANDVLALEIAAGGTQYSAQNDNLDSLHAFETLMSGDAWMIYRNVKTNVLHWDFSVVGRMITFPAADLQATGSINIDVSQIQSLGEDWNSPTLRTVAQELSAGSQDANSGEITGNRMFFANDYMVHRGNGYVTTLKMYSSRTVNSECVNNQNPFGFHLSDGTLYTYLQGDEYEDIAGAWDWNMIPGITTDYAATPLTCGHISFSSPEDFVGGASDGTVGVAAMQYQNPSTKSLSFQKAWFFLEDDVQHVMVSYVESKTSNPVRSVLDQKRHNGPVYVDGQPITGGGRFATATSLWHDNVGYTFWHRPNTLGGGLSIDLSSHTTNWQAIGISTVAATSVDLFSAWITHGDGDNLHVPVAYNVFPAVNLDDFATKSAQRSGSLFVIRNDKGVSAIFDEMHRTAMFVFWSENGGQATFTPSGGSLMVVEASGHSAIIWKLDENQITVSDPSQTLSNVQLSITTSPGQIKTLNVALPTGGQAGSSVTKTL